MKTLVRLPNDFMRDLTKRALSRVYPLETASAVSEDFRELTLVDPSLHRALRRALYHRCEIWRGFGDAGELRFQDRGQARVFQPVGGPAVVLARPHERTFEVIYSECESVGVRDRWKWPMRLARDVFFRTAEARGSITLHAAFLTYKGDGYLVVAPKGGGKTTVLLSLLISRNAEFGANDCTLVGRSDRGFELQSVPFGVRIGLGWWRAHFTDKRVGADHLGQPYSQLMRMSDEALWLEDRKIELTGPDFCDLFSVGTVSRAPLRFVILPRLTLGGGVLTIRRIKESDTLQLSFQTGRLPSYELDPLGIRCGRSLDDPGLLEELASRIPRTRYRATQLDQSSSNPLLLRSMRSRGERLLLCRRCGPDVHQSPASVVRRNRGRPSAKHPSVRGAPQVRARSSTRP